MSVYGGWILEEAVQSEKQKGLIAMNKLQSDYQSSAVKIHGPDKR